MKPLERRERIIELLKEHGRVEVTALRRLLNTSEMTIRRDLDALEKLGEVTRVYGGAVLKPKNHFDLPIEIREVEHLAEKQQMAALAARLVRNHEAIALDASSTALELAKALKNHASLTVVTSSLPIAMTLGRSPGIATYVTGGRIRRRNLSLVSSAAVRSIQKYRVDKAFISADGFSCRHGLTDCSPEETETKQAMIAVAKEVIALIDASKFGQVAFSQVCEAEKLTTLITSAGAPSDELAKVAELGVKVYVAGQETAAG